MKKTGNIYLILHGFLLALVGATAIALYILGFSQLYIGRNRPGGIELLISGLLLVVFYNRILPYLNRLSDWFDLNE